jgi:hypothetical protein
MKSIIANFVLQEQVATQKREQIEKRIEAKVEQIRKLQESINKLKVKEGKIKYPSWTEEIVEVLAQRLADKPNKKYEVCGPFGLRAETTIYLFNDENKSFTEQETWSITLTPGDLTKGEIYYDTGEKTNDFSPNSTGAINGMNNVRKPLPETIDEIVALLHYSKR